MSKAENCTTPIRRRAVLAGIASAAALPIAAAIPTAAVAGIPTSAAAAAEPDPAFALIAEKRAIDVAHGAAIDAQDAAEGRYGRGSDEVWEAAEHCEAACHAASEIEWRLADTMPTTLAGVAAVLRFANQIEDEGGE